MSQFPQDREDRGDRVAPDDRLVNFLHQHCPPVPPAAADLEDRVMQAVESLHPQPTRPKLWLVPGTLAASLLIAVAGYRLLTPATVNSVQLSHLEAFLENNWNGLVNTDEETIPTIEVASFLLDELATTKQLEEHQ